MVGKITSMLILRACVSDIMSDHSGSSRTVSHPVLFGFMRICVQSMLELYKHIDFILILLHNTISSVETRVTRPYRRLTALCIVLVKLMHHLVLNIYCVLLTQLQTLALLNYCVKVYFHKLPWVLVHIMFARVSRTIIVSLYQHSFILMLFSNLL